MKSGRWQQLKIHFSSFFSKPKETYAVKPIPGEDDPVEVQELPSFSNLKQRSKTNGDAGTQASKTQMTLPRLEDLKQTKGKPVTKALPAFEELAKLKKKADKEKARAPRPRLAKQLSVFKPLISGGHALFYRYIRLADEKNGDLAGPKGGACVLINMIDDRSFSFSFSICSPVDPFIKDEARRICQERFMKKMTCNVNGKDPTASCYGNILRAIDNRFLTKDTAPGEPVLGTTPGITDQHLKLLARFIYLHING